MYDIFLASLSTIDTALYNTVKTKYPNVQVVENCKSIQEIASKSFTKLFWVIWDDLQLNSSFNLYDYKATKWDDMYVHVFKNGEHKDGVCLFPKNLKISQREFNNRYFVEKKEIDIVASFPVTQIYDIVFISYNESNSDYNYEKLKEKFPRSKRINGVKGIHQAHIKAAEIAETEMFWVVDGDASIVDNFKFDYTVPRYERNHVHVWRSINPVNKLVYGYGGVKLLPKFKTLKMNVESADMTTSISNHFKLVPEISNITVFNTDPFSAWRSGFRECCKLSSKIIARQNNEETENRLTIWCTTGEDQPYGKYAVQGARSGKEYGELNSHNTEALKLINDFSWLKKRFDDEFNS